MGLGVWSRHIVTLCILPRVFKRVTRNKPVTWASQGVTFRKGKVEMEVIKIVGIREWNGKRCLSSQGRAGPGLVLLTAGQDMRSRNEKGLKESAGYE